MFYSVAFLRSLGHPLQMFIMSVNIAEIIV